MSDSNEVSIEHPAVSDTDAKLTSLSSSVRTLKIWLTVLTVMLVLAFGCAGMSIVTTVWGFGGLLGEMDGVSDESAANAEQEIRDAYGSRLASVEVRAVEVEYGATPFPYSIMDGMNSEQLYAEYRLSGTDVVFADLVGESMMGLDMASTGMLPLKGSLTSRMTTEQLDRLLAAYAAETRSPLGAVLRYGDSPFPDEVGSRRPEEVTVGATTYPASELWSAMEGRVVKGDRIDMNEAEESGRKAFIFHEDPETGEFEFLGTEPANSMW